MRHGKLHLSREKWNELYQQEWGEIENRYDDDEVMYLYTHHSGLFTHSTCAHCGVTKPNSMFYEDKREPDGLSLICKKCASEISKKVRVDNPKKAKAWGAVGYAVKIGKLPPARSLDCNVCGEPATGYHHFDYDEPLWVIPLCASCHQIADMERREREENEAQP